MLLPPTQLLTLRLNFGVSAAVVSGTANTGPNGAQGSFVSGADNQAAHQVPKPLLAESQ